MNKCIFCGENHNGNTLHRFVGADGIELVSKEKAREAIADLRNPNWGFEPALE